jgi:ethanolamine ammonia-lyase large subunit
MAIQIQFRRGLASEWTSANPTLAVGEMGLETDTDQFKIGDGTTAWNSLAYGGIAGATGPSGDPKLTINQQTESYTAVIADAAKLVEISSSSATTFSIPTDASVNFPVGTQISILQTGSGQVTIAAVTSGTTTVNATPGLKLRTQWSAATLIKRAANLWVVTGDLAA